VEVEVEGLELVGMRFDPFDDKIRGFLRGIDGTL
jgi:hypothetical protein